MISYARAMFIAEVLAGCAAIILLVAFVCCICSSTARNRPQLDQGTLEDVYTAPDAEELDNSRRQLPDAAPAYSTMPPLGPLSPEVVDAISRVSVERRQSLAISLLSSSRSFHHRTDSSSIDIGDGATQSSVVSSFVNLPPLHSLNTSPRSSVNSERLAENPADELHHDSLDRAPGSSQGPYIITSTRPIEQLQQVPPSYDPAWRTASHMTQEHSRQPRIRSLQIFGNQSPFMTRHGQGHGTGQRHDRNQHLLVSLPHRRTESLSGPSAQRALRYPSTRPRGLTLYPQWSTSGRSQSWTGEAVSFGYARSRNSSWTSSSDLPTQRSQLSFAWSPPLAPLEPNPDHQ
ncbi:hypothetical protein EDD21DRAFT_384999 [Dissophora ornata]|nr:hypothetical protein EDD21DRAFT_384999 [Dissophora ornata]